MKITNKIWFILFLVGILFSQESKERMRLVHADLMEGLVINGQNVRKLTGHVEFRQGKTLATCNQALEYIEEGIFEFLGDVTVIDEKKSIQGEIIKYFEDDNKTLAYFNVRLVDSTQTLVADTLEYLENIEKAIAKSNVVILNDSERVELTGRYAEYLRNEGYAKVTGDPVFTKRDSALEKDLVISGLLIEFFDDGKRVHVKGNVEIIRGKITARCGLLEYDKENEKVVLSISPKAKRVNDRLAGDSIDMLLTDNDVTDIIINGNAVISTKVDSAIKTSTPFDILTGEQIIVSVVQENIDTVYVKGRATSYYHVVDDSVEQGINKVLGDDLTMVFENSAIQQVKVASSPSLSIGSVYPPKSYNLVENELIALLAKNDILVAVEPDSATIRP
jgi:lipopolysaccharide export system protein LptA